MKDEVLQILKNCYAASPDMVQILDQDWNTVWCNRPSGISSLREQLMLPSDHWESCTKALILGEIRCQCHLLCDRVDGVRIAVINKESDLFETGMVYDTVHNIHNVCNSLYAALDALDLSDLREELDSITRNSYRFYRTALMQDTIRRMENGMLGSKAFSLNQAIQTLYDKVRNILFRCADVELHCCTEMLYMRGDLDAFLTAVLAGLVLCKPDMQTKAHFQISLEKAENTGILILSATPSHEENSYVGRSLSGHADGEKRMLDTWCREYGIRRQMLWNGNTVSCRLELPLCGEPTVIAFHSELEFAETPHYNKFEAMLAPVFCKTFF